MLEISLRQACGVDSPSIDEQGWWFARWKCCLPGTEHLDEQSLLVPAGNRSEAKSPAVKVEVR